MDDLTVAVLSLRCPDWLSGVAEDGARLLCVGAADAALLPQDRPDILFVDTPFALPPRRLALLIAQLRWGRPDLVVVMADGMIGQRHGFVHDLNFDPQLGAAHARDALALGCALMTRRRAGTAPQKRPIPKLLRRPSVRRVSLFR